MSLYEEMSDDKVVLCVTPRHCLSQNQGHDLRLRRNSRRFHIRTMLLIQVARARQLKHAYRHPVVSVCLLCLHESTLCSLVQL